MFKLFKYFSSYIGMVLGRWVPHAQLWLCTRLKLGYICECVFRMNSLGSDTDSEGEDDAKWHYTPPHQPNEYQLRATGD